VKPVFHLITTIERGGAEKQLLILAKEQVFSGRDVHIGYLKGVPELQTQLEDIGVTVHRELSNRSVISQIRILRELTRHKGFVLHAHLPRAELIASIGYKDDDFFVSRHNAEPFFPGAPKLVSRVGSLFATRRARGVIAISKAVAAYLIQNKEIRKTKNLKVVLYGYEPQKISGVQPLKDNPKSLKLGTISRLTNQKDIPTLLVAFSEVSNAIPSATLEIIGDGPLRKQMEKLTESLGLSSKVTFLGRTGEINKYLSMWDIFLLTSKYEGFGLVLLEAMDQNIPIVASNNSAIPEVLGEEFPGLCRTGEPSDFASKVMEISRENQRELYQRIQKNRLLIFGSTGMRQKIDAVYSS
jgi:glycosyltransferase involved in cell wall biosynthesis